MSYPNRTRRPRGAAAHHRLSLSTALLGLAFPVVHSVYSMIRGAIITWAPYPFYNLAEVGGAIGVVTAVAYLAHRDA